MDHHHTLPRFISSLFKFVGLMTIILVVGLVLWTAYVGATIALWLWCLINRQFCMFYYWCRVEKARKKKDIELREMGLDK